MKVIAELLPEDAAIVVMARTRIGHVFIFTLTADKLFMFGLNGKLKAHITRRVREVCEAHNLTLLQWAVPRHAP